jgi:hypothetical protein
MTERNPQAARDVDDFILANIDSVPHLETLMLLWDRRPHSSTVDELAARLYVQVDRVSVLLRDLIRLQLVESSENSPVTYRYLSHSSAQDDLMRHLDEAYRHEIVRISTMIHLKTSSPVREFARAFQLKKEQDK